LLEYPNLYSDRIKVFEKVLEFYKKAVPVNQLKKQGSRKLKNSPKRIAIITGQLLSLNHSPTILALNRAKNLKRYSECEVKVFVDHMFVYSPKEVIFPYFFSSAESYSLNKVHQEFLEEGISIYYSESGIDRLKRI